MRTSPLFTLLSSALVFGSVTLLVRHGWVVASHLSRGRVERDAETFRVWSQELFLGWSPEKVRRMAVLANAAVPAIFVVIWLLTRSVVFAAAAAAAAFFVPRMLYRVARERRLQRLEEQLPDAISLMVSSVRAGRALPQAIEDVSQKMEGPAGEEFGVMAGEYAYGGMNLEGVLERARARLNVESFTMISSALIINAEHGGDVLHMLERMAEAIRELERLRKKIRTETSEVRSQEKVILLMTPLFGVLVCLFDPEIPDILFNSWQGQALLVVVVALQLFSMWWIHRIIKSTI
jgi:tight adherence protein B